MVRTKLEKIMLTKVREILNICDFIEGMGKTEAQIKNEKKPMYWSTLLENSEASKKDCYIVYHPEVGQDSYYGDGASVLARLGCRIDLFLSSPSESKNTYNIRNKIETNFSKDTWSIVFNLEEYDEKVKLHHYSYTVYNIYGEE